MPSNVPLRGLRIDDALYQKICYLAGLEERSFNQEATYILRRFVADFEKAHGPIPLQPTDRGEEA